VSHEKFCSLRVRRHIALKPKQESYGLQVTSTI